MRIEGVEGVDEEIVKMALEDANKRLDAMKREAEHKLALWSLGNFVWTMALLVVTAYMAAKMWH